MQRLIGRKIIKYTLLSVWIMVSGVVISARDAVEIHPQAEFNYLKQRLLKDGVRPDLISKYFNDHRFRLMPELLTININQPSAKSAYKKFTSTGSVRTTADFLNRNRSVFDSVLSGTRVNPEIVAAILQVESGLGSNQGKHPLFNVYASLTLLGNEQLELVAPDFWSKILEKVDSQEHPKIRKKVTKRAQRKSEWAYKQLFALMKMASEERLDPLNVKGSWAGAFGLPQFIPTTLEAYGRDGDGDGTVDIFKLEDAVASIAHYLEKHGYRQDHREKRRRAIWHYNHSYEYVDCIMTLADKVDLWNHKNLSRKKLSELQ